jgi:hypothetical protein
VVASSSPPGGHRDRTEPRRFSASAFAPGEPPPCSGILGRPAGEAAAAVRRRGLRPLWAGDLPLGPADVVLFADANAQPGLPSPSQDHP